MKKVKKLLALMLALAMLMAMTACGSEPKGSVSTGADSGSSTSSTPEATPEPTPEPEDELELGSMVGGIYENDFAGIGCKLDETWTYLSEEEILAQNEVMIESVDDDELAELLSDKGTFYDMVAMSEETLSTVNVVVENLGLLYGAALDAGKYVDISLESLEGQLGSMGMSVTSCEKESVDFCGKATDGIYIAGTMDVEGYEVEMFERIACVKAGTYMFVITACTYVEDTTADVLALFYSV
ncbi:MAG: hypothetical protein NC319_00820 [Butyricicoccus sp.]|nr:hypothetical protein [Butyricicoccus sp.]